MKCKDIPDRPILELLARNPGKGGHTWHPGFENSVRPDMPQNTPEKLVLAKMRMLFRRGLIGGCVCGCRGGFEITEKGKNFLA